MANELFDNTYVVQESDGGRLSWNRGARVQSVVFFAIDTRARATFQIYAGTPILEWGILGGAGTNADSGNSFINQTYSVPIGGVAFEQGWIPTTMTACTAWIHFG